MAFGREQNRRQSIRLPSYDYAQAGAYFVTICTYNRDCLLGEIPGSEMSLTRAGEVALGCWNDLPNHYSHVEIDEFVVMPNHVHGIIVLTDQQGKTSISESVTGAGRGQVGAGLKPAPTERRHPLPEIVRAFKTFSSRRINERRGSPGVPVWQRNYYERVIRDERELDAIRQYIVDNPAKWAEDIENPQNLHRK